MCFQVFMISCFHVFCDCTPPNVGSGTEPEFEVANPCFLNWWWKSIQYVLKSFEKKNNNHKIPPTLIPGWTTTNWFSSSMFNIFDIFSLLRPKKKQTKMNTQQTNKQMPLFLFFLTMKPNAIDLIISKMEMQHLTKNVMTQQL